MGYIGIMENKMETTITDIVQLGLGVAGLQALVAYICLRLVKLCLGAGVYRDVPGSGDREKQ